MKTSLLITTLIISFFINRTNLYSEDGYRLWLRYDKVTNKSLLKSYTTQIKYLLVDNNSPTLSAVKEELQNGLTGLLGKNIPVISATKNRTVIASNYKKSKILKELSLSPEISNIPDDGYLIQTLKHKGNDIIVITSNSDVGVMYGTFEFLRLLQTQKPITNLKIISYPKIKLRILNHWDNLNRTVERGYAGFSIWDWHKLPDYIDTRYKDYARANASIGINGTVLTNVNANAWVLTHDYLLKVAALANVFRTYGIKVYLTARFSAPIEIGNLKTADPLNEDVRQWWKEKVKEIYSLIPDFGGFLVKANSEGQPGPQNYGRSHADGANMLAEALEPYGGVVMWRAFVYDNNIPEDRAKQAYNEFKPLDGKFKKNVLIQVKNGPIDFQPREPFHPLFGAMPNTPLMMEFQITQEYLGQGTHLVYLATLFKECLESDTYCKGKGSTVAKVIDGSLDNHSISGIAGVSNIGTDRNWTGHLFGQANWYAFGRLAWNHELTSEEVAEEWIRQTFSNDNEVVSKIKTIMLKSREDCVNYMTPLGLHHIMGWNHHYGPAPWIKDKHRDDWTSVYYHRADSNGIGFDRTEKGSNAVSQYYPEVAEIFSSLEKCPDEYLLWFHHLPWNYKMKSGNTLWEELCYHYYKGVEGVKETINIWKSLESKIDKDEFEHVKMLLNIQLKEAIWWRNACVLYFQTFSKMPIPNELEKPDKSLEYYMNLNFPYAPGI
ncbi:alpha-glucuronidase family glycosyl hydrolase [Ignavibacteria bacterium 4148-Me]|uniref:alpha-glucuronidase family glycosyl hydrolase n=1 Tax=Rosettibacter primus TaxID=3111523 RepID=UPI00336C13D5